MKIEYSQLNRKLKKNWNCYHKNNSVIAIQLSPNHIFKSHLRFKTSTSSRSLHCSFDNIKQQLIFFCGHSLSKNLHAKPNLHAPSSFNQPQQKKKKRAQKKQEKILKLQTVYIIHFSCSKFLLPHICMYIAIFSVFPLTLILLGKDESNRGYRKPK